MFGKGKQVTSGRVAARREATKAAILDAAWDLASGQGLGGLNMRDLAAKLGMSAPSLYEYFDGKDAIYDAMFVHGNALLSDRMRDAPDPAEAGPRVALTAQARRFVEFCNEDEARFQLLFQRAVPGWRPSPEAYEVAVGNLDKLRAYLASCGISDAASLDLWTAILSGLAGQQVANDLGGDRWIRLIEPAVDMFLATRKETR